MCSRTKLYLSEPLKPFKFIMPLDGGPSLDSYSVPKISDSASELKLQETDGEKACGPYRFSVLGKAHLLIIDNVGG